MDLQNATAWDVATRYHEFKSKRSVRGQEAKHLRKLSASAILDRAQQVLGSVVHPVEQRIAPWSELPAQAEQADIELEETLENSPLAMIGVLHETGTYPLTEQYIWTELQRSPSSAHCPECRYQPLHDR